MLTKLTSNSAFKGYLSIRDNGIADIQEQKIDKNGKVTYFKSIDNLLINTDQIISANTINKGPIGGKAVECTYIDMANGTRYAIENRSQYVKLQKALVEALKKPNEIIDLWRNSL